MGVGRGAPAEVNGGGLIEAIRMASFWIPSRDIITLLFTVMILCAIFGISPISHIGPICLISDGVLPK
jgi:hypothetical protein